MSVQAVEWAIHQKTGDSRKKVILIVLANHANNQGYCWPSQALLAKYAECSVDTIQRQLQRIEKTGLITRQRRNRDGRRTSDVYQLHLDRGEEAPENSKRQSICPTPYSNVALAKPHSGAVSSPRTKPHPDAASSKPHKNAVGTTTTEPPEGRKKESHALRADARHSAGNFLGSFEADFETWWQAFPGGRKRGKGRACVDFERALLGTGPCRLRATPAVLIAAARAYAATEPDPDYVPLPSTWLNQGRWLDDLEPPAPKKATGWREEKRQQDAEFMKLVKGGPES